MVTNAFVPQRNLLLTTLSGGQKQLGHKYASIVLLLVLLILVRYHSFSLGHSACTSPRARHCSGSESTFAILLRRVKLMSLSPAQQVWIRWKFAILIHKRLWHTPASSTGTINRTRNPRRNRQIRTNTTRISWRGNDRPEYAKAPPESHILVYLLSQRDRQQCRTCSTQLGGSLAYPLQYDTPTHLQYY
ncbi:hypothetical protein EDB89DRAFT_265992 [Lactarius sanguifluus]|nr:hypothetical protein EDB89DRAFT_265992 [Lactarius sanguifluus]